ALHQNYPGTGRGSSPFLPKRQENGAQTKNLDPKRASPPHIPLESVPSPKEDRDTPVASSGQDKSGAAFRRTLLRVGEPCCTPLIILSISCATRKKRCKPPGSAGSMRWKAAATPIGEPPTPSATSN